MQSQPTGYPGKGQQNGTTAVTTAAAAQVTKTSTRRLKIYLIRPSRYDDEGFVVRHFRGVIPSNTLFSLNGLTRDLARSGVLGDVRLETKLVDEAVQKVPLSRMLRENRREGTQVVAALCGVQSNQYARAADLAKRFRGHGLDVLIGGFHVSGANALLPGTNDEISELIELGVHVVRGEVDACWQEIVEGLLDGTLPGMVDRLTDRPNLRERPIPAVDRRYMKKFAMPDLGTIDAGRGCPFECSFCTIINVQGRKMRCRSPESILGGMREQYQQGIRHYFFTDDNFSRHTDWEGIFDGMAAMRAEGFNLSFMMQVDTQATRLPRFVEKAALAGCRQVFIGLESISAENLAAAGKRQNRVENFRDMTEQWHKHQIVAQCGYIVGFPADTPESIASDVRRLREEVGIDQASFFILTPLPGSEDHARAVRGGVALDTDLNLYDSVHTVMEHPKMSRDELIAAYKDAWHQFYTMEHMISSLKRFTGENYWSLFNSYMWYRNSMELGEHPMMSGFWRKRDRLERRPGLSIPGRLAHTWARVKHSVAQIRIVLKLVPEMQELWLATRTQDPNEGRIKTIVKSMLTFKPRELVANASARLHRWRKSRVDLSTFWKSLSRFRWWRVNPLKAPLNVIREWALLAHFMISVYQGANNDRRIAYANPPT